MSMVKHNPRNLVVTQRWPDWRDGVPEQPYDWTDDELTEWKAYLESTGRLGRRNELAWDNVHDCRHARDGLHNQAIWRTGIALPPEVFATLPLDVMAQRYYGINPALAKLSHRAGEGMRAIPSGRRPNSAAMERLVPILRGLNGRRGVLKATGTQTLLVGGLGLRLAGGEARIELFGKPAHQFNCTDAAMSGLITLYRRWVRLVRMCIAESLEHAIEPSWRRLECQVRLVLPLESKRSVCTVLASSQRGLGRETLRVVDGRDPFADWEERYGFAGKVVDAITQYPSSESTGELEAVVRTFHARVPLLQPITIEAPTRQELESRVDDLSRQNIRALRDGVEVDLLDPHATGYEVFQDTIIGLEKIAELRSFGLAVDFERSNRKKVTMRLSMGVGAGRLPIPGEERLVKVPANSSNPKRA